MIGISEGLIIGSLKQVVYPETEETWDLTTDLTGQAARDLRDFIQADVTAGNRSVHGTELFLIQQIEALIRRRIDKKSEGLDEYESFVIAREGLASFHQLPIIAQDIHNFIFPKAR